MLEVTNGIEWSRFFAKHVVTFESVYTVPCEEGQPSTEHLWVITAFVISIKGCWFFMTAGHVFPEIRRFQVAGITFSMWRLHDSWGLESKHKGPIPVDLENMPKQVLHFDEEHLLASEEKSGLDYAFMPVPPLIGMNLASNNIQPIPEEMWKVPIDTLFDEYWMFGFPSELCSPPDHSSMVAVSVDRLEEVPEEMKRITPCFYGKLPDIKLPDGTSLKSIKGMSGAPIFGLKGERYKLLALQSSWYKTTRNIIAVSMEHVGTWLEQELAPFMTDESFRDATEELKIGEPEPEEDALGF